MSVVPAWFSGHARSDSAVESCDKVKKQEIQNEQDLCKFKHDGVRGIIAAEKRLSYGIVIRVHSVLLNPLLYTLFTSTVSVKLVKVQAPIHATRHIGHMELTASVYTNHQWVL